MASLITHSLVGLTIAKIAPETIKNKKFYFWMGFLPLLADFDYIGFVMKIPYGSAWGHRGMTHSLLFCFLVALLASWFFQKRLQVFSFFFLALVTHPVLDALTNGGLGVAFYAPYNLTRYFFPWRPIEVSPMGIRFFSERGLVVLISEFFWVWIPCALIVTGSLLLARKRASSAPPLQKE